ncbi:hypothetical protein [Pseudomonas koreensis]|uniref:Uncharacterized protein n=1 Tax=Pseudomonas koreensis TaxID=198620 RepID=A0A9X3B283_9PSED|nr:hypothetical protein [Pseudomonas koreensis]MCU7247937.1 hypothetical protein [Pseudomonas koreensis]
MSHPVTVTEDFETVAETSIVAGQSIETPVMKIEFLKGAGVVEIRKKNPPDMPGKIESNVLQLNWVPRSDAQEIKISPNKACSTISFWFDKWTGISDFYIFDGDKLLAEISPESGDTNNFLYTNKKITHIKFDSVNIGLNMDNFKFTQ